MIDLTLSRPLGSTKLTVGSLGLGVAPLGYLFTPVSNDDAQDTLTAAERLGISWFDVAPYYGCGLAEARLGQFLQKSTKVGRTISTKVGRILLPTESPPAHPQYVSACPNQPVFDYTRAGIERSYKDSLKRLGVERVEILLLHDVDRLSHPHGHRQLVRDLLRDGIPTLQRLKAQGAVDAIGLGINEWDIGYEIVSNAEIDCVLLAGRYTLLDNTAFASGFLDTCARRGVSVLAGGVFNSGFLAGGNHYAYCAADQALVAAREALLNICRRHDVELPAVAMQLSGENTENTSVVDGESAAQEVDEICRWAQVEIPAKLWAELRSARLIPAEAPLPGT